ALVTRAPGLDGAAEIRRPGKIAIQANEATEVRFAVATLAEPFARSLDVWRIGLQRQSRRAITQRHGEVASRRSEVGRRSALDVAIQVVDSVLLRFRPVSLASDVGGAGRLQLEDDHGDTKP